MAVKAVKATMAHTRSTGVPADGDLVFCIRQTCQDQAALVAFCCFLLVISSLTPTPTLSMFVTENRTTKGYLGSYRCMVGVRNSFRKPTQAVLPLVLRRGGGDGRWCTDSLAFAVLERMCLKMRELFHKQCDWRSQSRPDWRSVQQKVDRSNAGDEGWRLGFLDETRALQTYSFRVSLWHLPYLPRSPVNKIAPLLHNGRTDAIYGRQQLILL